MGAPSKHFAPPIGQLPADFSPPNMISHASIPFLQLTWLIRQSLSVEIKSWDKFYAKLLPY